MLATDHASPEPDPLVPGHRMKADKSGFDRLVQVVTPLCRLVHVATENLPKRYTLILRAICNMKIWPKKFSKFFGSVIRWLDYLLVL